MTRALSNLMKTPEMAIRPATGFRRQPGDLTQLQNAATQRQIVGP